MEVIHLYHPHDLNNQDLLPMAMAFGYFDGVHLGHQKVILTAKKIATEMGIKSAVMTFDPHPSVVLRKEVQHVEYITPLEEKTKLIADLGIDYLFIVHFTQEFASLLPQEFVDQYVIGLNAVHFIAGFDYSYGKMGKGTMETIPFHSRGKFEYTTVPKLVNHEEKVSSTLIRASIKEGKMDELPSLLGRYFTTSGVVIHGDKRGRTIGFPTANIEINEEYLLPPVGVYSVRFFVANVWYEGVCNIGYKPTFNKEQMIRPSVEVHIFDFNQDIYGEQVIVEWHKRIRSEKKFSGIDELVSQIQKDKDEALHYFEKNNV